MTTARPAGRRLLWAVGLLVLCCCWSRPVEASEVRDLYRQAMARHALAEFEDAIRLLTRARAAARDTGLLGKIYLDPGGVVISAAAQTQQQCSLARAPGGYLVAWQDYRNGSTADIYGARVTP